VPIVVNVLRFSDPVDLAIFRRAEIDLAEAMRAIDGFAGLEIVHSGEAEVVLLISADTVETLDRIATEVGSPWMVTNVVPLLTAPPERHVGPVVARIER
jgi:hypothetical protein